MSQETSYTDLEYEVIGLMIAIRTLDSMVNREVLEFLGAPDKTDVMFKSMTHQMYFYIILTDFLSENSDATLTQGKKSCLEILMKIIEDPKLPTQNINSLTTSLHALEDWLNKVVTRQIWSASIDRELSLPLTRLQMISFSGNYSKHHFAHLTHWLNRIEKIIGIGEIPRHMLIPALDNIYDDLHDNVLNYHASNISELLNNVRWGIHEYLGPEFERSYRKLEDIFYEFDTPSGIKTDFARSCYWDLMNSVRSKPYVDKFKANEIYKLRF